MDKHLPNNLVMVTKFLVPVTKCFYSVVENGDFRFIRSLSSEHFTYMATRQRSGDTTVNDLRHISRSLDCFTSNFSKSVCDTAKVTIDN